MNIGLKFTLSCIQLLHFIKLDHFNENAKTIFDMITTTDVLCSKVKTLYGDSLLGIFGFNIIICKAQLLPKCGGFNFEFNF
jgi:hypothetical protein